MGEAEKGGGKKNHALGLSVDDYNVRKSAERWRQSSTHFAEKRSVPKLK